MTFELIGMLDSPYVRRVAVSMHLMAVPFVHHPVSVFGDFDRFQAINPVVKAPTLVTGNGEVLMDSTLILDYLESLVPPARRLLPADPSERLRTLRLTGLALAACEKAVQIVYERRLRPSEKRHAPWLDRISLQLTAAYRELEQEIALHPIHWQQRPDDRQPTDTGGISAAIAWHFTQRLLPGTIPPDRHPHLSAWSALAETQPSFAAAAHPD